MVNDNISYRSVLFVFFCAAVLLAIAASPSLAGTAIGWEGETILEKIAESLSGPIARNLAIICLVSRHRRPRHAGDRLRLMGKQAQLAVSRDKRFLLREELARQARRKRQPHLLGAMERTVIHQSLVRPQLIMGCDRELYFALVALALVPRRPVRDNGDELRKRGLCRSRMVYRAEHTAAYGEKRSLHETDFQPQRALQTFLCGLRAYLGRSAGI